MNPTRLWTHRCVPVSLAILSALFVLSRPAAADLTVSQGWDLLETAQPSGINFGFGNVPLQGVPLGQFDFATGTGGDLGRGLGVLPVGQTDTIVKRLQSATVLGPLPQVAASLPIELVALQLQTSAPINLGAGNDLHFFTLQTMRSAAEITALGVGTLTQGTITVAFDNDLLGVQNGTFDTVFTAFFDIRIGAVNGPIINSTGAPFSRTGVAWSHTPGASALLLNNANNQLNGANNGSDFFWRDIQNGSSNPHHSVVGTSAAPEPATFALFGVGLIIGTALRRKR
ncbi:PEP-CTERM sorting domain-containing protein [Armatimonas sp.]|uniref:PEP-CTERM sorting domain-containing protein n=1 Tax=Armatimonas sp. TaxID=1872638 RepID=UPI00374D3B68